MSRRVKQMLTANLSPSVEAAVVMIFALHLRKRPDAKAVQVVVEDRAYKQF